MKKLTILLLAALLLAGCAAPEAGADIAATTLPVWEFTQFLCQGTGLQVERLVTENVSCLHDYSLNVRQVKAVEQARVIVMNGAGLEDFLEDVLCGKPALDASLGLDLMCPEDAHHHGQDTHHHEQDPHIWLSPAMAMTMSKNICAGLSREFPEYCNIFETNLSTLLQKLEELERYGQQTLSALSTRQIITFHDGFGYFARSFGLEILEAVEEESGSEASARELKHLITLVRKHDLPAIFVEANGSDAAALVIARETGAQVFTLDMAMSGNSYFDAMYRNIDTLKEALE